MLLEIVDGNGVDAKRMILCIGKSLTLVALALLAYYLHKNVRLFGLDLIYGIDGPLWVLGESERPLRMQHCRSRHFKPALHKVSTEDGPRGSVACFQCTILTGTSYQYFFQ